jgi:hypothetical protein
MAKETSDTSSVVGGPGMGKPGMRGAPGISVVPMAPPVEHSAVTLSSYRETLRRVEKLGDPSEVTPAELVPEVTLHESDQAMGVVKAHSPRR